MTDELEEFRLAEQQRRDWEDHMRFCERQGRCPHSGEKFAVCKQTVCDCFDYDYEAKIQRWERFKWWWAMRPSSPRNWHRWATWRLWGKRRQDRWADQYLLGGSPDSQDGSPF